MKKVHFALLPLAALTANVFANSNLDTINVESDNYSPQVSNIAAKGVVKVRQATKMSDVLRGVPGVNVNGARSAVERYNIRGVSEEYLTVTVDGARQNGYAFHHAGNYGIDPEILKRVDIDVGSNSVVTGAGSLGGSIKFETVDAADLLEDGQNIGAKLKYAYGSNGNSHQGMATVYGRADNLDLLGYFNYRHQKDGKDGDGIRNANKGHLQNYLFKAKYNISPDQWIKLSAERYTNTALSCFRANFGSCLGDIPQPVHPDYNPSNHSRATTELLRKTYTLGYSYNPSENPFINLKANLYSTDTQMSSMGQAQTSIKTIGGTLSNTSDITWGNTHHSITLGGEYYNTKAQALGKTGLDAFKTSLYSTSVYLEDQIALGNFIITPGIRYDYYKAKLSPTFNKNYNRLSKALGLKYFITDALVVFANYTELFKGPDTGEVTLRGSRVYSPDLDAIRGKNKEIGFNFAKEGFFADNDVFSITAKYFRTDYDNLNKNISLAGFSGYKSVGPVKLDGIEASARYRINNLSLALSYARARSEQTSSEGSRLGVSGYNAFADTGDRYTVSASYTLPEHGVEMGWNTTWVRGIDIFEEKSSGRGPRARYFSGYSHKDAYTVSNLYISWTPQQVKGLELVFGIDNVFNKAYKDQSNQYYTAADKDPGRNYKLTASYKF